MELLFVDETGRHVDGGGFHFGLCLASINHSHYRTLKDGVLRILREGGWDCEKEFKGRDLFSSSGMPNVTVEKRVEMCSRILDLNMASKNARMRFFYCGTLFPNESHESKKGGLPILVESALRSRGHRRVGRGKDLCLLACDRCDNGPVSASEIRRGIMPIIQRKGYCLFEDIQMVRSGPETVGILFADIVAYLYAGSITGVPSDAGYFEGFSEEHPKMKRMKTSKMLLEKLKFFVVKDLSETQEKGRGKIFPCLNRRSV